MLDSVINWNIIKSPVNWAIVILMLIIGGLAFEIIASHYADLTGSSTKDAT